MFDADLGDFARLSDQIDGSSISGIYYESEMQKVNKDACMKRCNY